MYELGSWNTKAYIFNFYLNYDDFENWKLCNYLAFDVSKFKADIEKLYWKQGTNKFKH